MTVISKYRKWHLRKTYLKFFPGAACPQTSLEAHVCNNHLFKLTGLESLKLAFLKFKLKFNSPALCFIQLKTGTFSVAPGVGHFLLFPAPHGEAFVAFCTLLKLIPTYIPGWGGSGFTLTGALYRYSSPQMNCDSYDQGGLEALPMIQHVKVWASFFRYKQNLVII